MKLVIDIDEELYKNVVEHTKVGYVGSDVWIAVANGTPLPEGHGELTDQMTQELIDKIMTNIGCAKPIEGSDTK